MTQQEIDSWKKNAFQQATQYYVTARFAYFAGLIPVCGNLFHHAIEMYLKAALSSSVSVEKLKKDSHCLKKLWDRFKKEMADLSLTQFDCAIRRLNKFEKIRYPDNLVSKPSTITHRSLILRTTSKNC
jgi:HEPN domain-containing protein